MDESLAVLEKEGDASDPRVMELKAQVSTIFIFLWLYFALFVYFPF